jgi:hypothetical protein
MRNRLGRCYELAWRATVEEPGSEQFTLVHGRTAFGGHAWVWLPDGRIYDPTLDCHLTKDEYVGAIAEATYTREQALKALIITGHYGPWHE